MARGRILPPEANAGSWASWPRATPKPRCRLRHEPAIWGLPREESTGEPPEYAMSSSPSPLPASRVTQESPVRTPSRLGSSHWGPTQSPRMLRAHTGVLQGAGPKTSGVPEQGDLSLQVSRRSRWQQRRRNPLRRTHDPSRCRLSEILPSRRRLVRQHGSARHPFPDTGQHILAVRLWSDRDCHSPIRSGWRDPSLDGWGVARLASTRQGFIAVRGFSRTRACNLRMPRSHRS